MKNPKETKEVKEVKEAEKIEETEKKSDANPLDEWFTEGKASNPNDFNIKYLFWQFWLKSLYSKLQPH